MTPIQAVFLTTLLVALLISILIMYKLSQRLFAQRAMPTLFDRGKRAVFVLVSAPLSLWLLLILLSAISILLIFVIYPWIVETHALHFLTGNCYFPEYANGILIAPTSWQYQQESSTIDSVEDVKNYYENMLNPRQDFSGFRLLEDNHIWTVTDNSKNGNNDYLFACYARHSNKSTGETACIYVYENSETRIKTNWQLTPVDFPPVDCQAWLSNEQ
ncbi:MAG: hypothetical protein KC415_18175 [Anaerolineales bacterium]|nr:hypothetical protein [Anaerolineales bacterium]